MPEGGCTLRALERARRVTMALREPAWSSLPAHAWLARAPLRGARRRGTLLEMMLVVAIVGVLLTAFARILQPLTIKLGVLEATSLFITHRADALAFMATTGRLPPEPAPQRATKYFAAPRWQDQELVFPVAGPLLQRLLDTGAVEPGSGATVSFRVATSVNGNTVWLCGGRDAPAGFAAAPMRHTTMPVQYLPHFCRSATLAP
jgi:type II secretory pathway pseudopilin PulG